MAESQDLPIIFLAFANPPPGAQGYLRNLGEEARQLERTLEQAKQMGLCELVVKSYASLDSILEVFRKHSNRIAIFHYAGHAKNFDLLLEDAVKGTVAVDSRGLAAFLGEQTGLQLVFLNGCSTQPQVEELLAANVPTVIATSQAIQDDVATLLASEFYASLASGGSIRSAFNEAKGVVKAKIGIGKMRDAYFEDAETVADRWPWDLSFKEGSEQVVQWNLPDVVDDPLFGLPPLPKQCLRLPASPFRHLNYFTQDDAQVFFGREHKIRALYDLITAPDSAPIILFYGQSGVGKSSLLDAGLLPRLQTSHTVRYARREQSLGLLETLAEAMSVSESEIPSRWHSHEQEKPLVVILDQVEEIYTKPNPTQPNELTEFLTALEPLLACRNSHPKGKLILGFRKEWFAEIETAILSHHLPYRKLFLPRLSRQGIIKAISGICQQKELQQHYGLTIEEELPGLVANDLLGDPGSPVSTILQVLLTEMWEKAIPEDSEMRRFSKSLYQGLKRKGNLLDNFFNNQLAQLKEWNPEIVNSGLAIDVLAAHTTPLGTARELTEMELLTHNLFHCDYQLRLYCH